MSRHPPVPDGISPMASAPTWAPVHPDPDLEEAATEDPSLAPWIASLASQGQAAMDDNLEELLYSQAPDALRQAGIDPTVDAIETWVAEQVRRASP